MSKFTCPYCYGTHDLGDCNLLCKYNIAGDFSINCPKKVSRDSAGFVPQKFKKICFGCNLAMKNVYCPNYEANPVPRDFLTEGGLPIAVVGAKATGKSNYIGVLITEIKKRMSSKFNCSLAISADEISRDLYNNNYYYPLYESGFPVAATDSGEVTPMIFPLRFMDPKTNRIKNTVNLTFYDTAGENLDSIENMTIYNKYIPNAKGLILLLDPLQVPAIRKKLEAKGFNLPPKNSDVVEVLDSIIQLIRNQNALKSNQKIKMPVAITFTKMDVLEQYNDLIDPDSILRVESYHVKYSTFVESYNKLFDSAMKDLLEELAEDSEIITKLKEFESYSFFGVSALGSNPVNNTLSSNTIKPEHVLDPLLWLLSQYKFISVDKKIQYLG